MTSVEPASWWSPSMFWVTTVRTSPARSRSTTARWPALGRAESIGESARLRQVSRRTSGSARKLWIV